MLYCDLPKAQQYSVKCKGYIRITPSTCTKKCVHLINKRIKTAFSIGTLKASILKSWVQVLQALDFNHARQCYGEMKGREKEKEKKETT